MCGEKDVPSLGVVVLDASRAADVSRGRVKGDTATEQNRRLVETNLRNTAIQNRRRASDSVVLLPLLLHVLLVPVIAVAVAPEAAEIQKLVVLFAQHHVVAQPLLALLQQPRGK